MTRATSAVATALRVVRSWFVFVRVGVRLQQLGDVGAIAGDRPRKVGDLRRRGHDLQLARLTRRSRAACGDTRQQREPERDEGRAPKEHAASIQE